MDHLQSALQITFAQKSEAGRKPENQDTLGARIPEGNLLTTKGIAIAVADGVSSSKAAREASQTAIAGFLNDYYATPDTWRTQQSAIRVIQSLNAGLWGRSQNSIYGEGYLTTFSSLILKGSNAFAFHVGDTRVYRLRENNLELITRDHTQRIDKYTVHLCRAMGADPYVEVDMHCLELQRGDIFVLTSDGIHEKIPPQEFKKLLLDYSSNLDELVNQALVLALQYGSDDNLSIQALEVNNIGTAGQDEAVKILSRLPFPPVLLPGQSIDNLRVKKILHESKKLLLVYSSNLDELVNQALVLALQYGSDDNLSIQALEVNNIGTAGQDEAVKILSRLPFPPVLLPGQSIDNLRVKKILHES